MPYQVGSSPVVSLAEFEEAASHVSRHAYHTPLLTSRLLSQQTGFDIRLKAEMFQKGGSYKVRGPLNKFRHLTADERRRGVICSSAGNHAQGVAIAAAVYKMKAVVVMASNATQSKVDATRAYGAEVQRFVDDIVTLPDREIFDAMIWIMSHCKLVVEGAAAAPVAALLHGLIKAPAGSKVVAVLSGGNVNFDQIRNLKWN